MFWSRSKIIKRLQSYSDRYLKDLRWGLPIPEWRDLHARRGQWIINQLSKEKQTLETGRAQDLHNSVLSDTAAVSQTSTSKDKSPGSSAELWELDVMSAIGADAAYPPADAVYIGCDANPIGCRKRPKSASTTKLICSSHGS